MVGLMTSAHTSATSRNGPTSPNAILAIRDLNVYYGAFHAVGDVSFDVPKHRITALIGPVLSPSLHGRKKDLVASYAQGDPVE